MRKNIVITLDRERQLRLDLNAMAEFEDLTGKSLFTIGEALQEAKHLRALLFVAMKSAGEEITLSDVGNMIGLHNFNVVNDAVTQLMRVSYGSSDEEATEGKK
jgi:hypothetical protein